jgi:hypothetical protein
LKNESENKTDFVKAIRSVPGWYATRIEDKYRVGVPDIIVGIPLGPTLMIEAKMIANQSFGPTPRQFVELQRFGDAHRAALLLGFKEGVMYLHGVAEQVKISDCLASLPGEAPHQFIMRFIYNG